jgi:hypothetical protein
MSLIMLSKLAMMMMMIVGNDILHTFLYRIEWHPLTLCMASPSGEVISAAKTLGVLPIVAFV